VKFARIIFANLFRMKVRLLLTVGSFAVALFLFAFLAVVKVAFHFGADAAVADRLIVINRTSFLNTIPLAYRDKILRIPGVKYVTHNNWFAGVYQDEKLSFPQFAIDPDWQRQVYPEFIISDEQWKDFLKDRQGAIAGAKTAARFHWKIGDRVPLRATIYGSDYRSGTWEMNLVGIYRGKRPQDDETQFWFKWDYFDDKMPAHLKGQIGWYVVRVENAADSPRIAKTIDDEFANSSNETRTATESAFAAEMVKAFANIQSLILLIGAVVFFTLLLVAGNTMAIAVRERSAELAIFKAIGFSNLTLLSLVIGESLIIAFTGGTLGLILALIAVPAISQALSGLLPPLVFSPQILLFGLVMALAVGVMSGLIPGIIVMRMRVTKGLRKV
jgi:putative ABC transport system permease protein